MKSGRLVIIVAIVLSVGYVVATSFLPQYNSVASALMLAVIAAFLAGIYEEIKRANDK